MSILDIFKIKAIKAENENLKKIFEEIGATEAIAVKKKIDEYQSDVRKLQEKIDSLNSSIRILNQDEIDKKNQIIVIEEELLLESFALYKPKFKFQTSSDFKDQLDKIRENQKTLIKNGFAITANENWTVNNSKVEGKKMVNDMKKLLVRSFNNECDYCVDNVKFNNIETHEKRIEKSFETLNKLGRILDAKITETYKKLKFDELHLAFEYQTKKAEEKEEQKRAREELREQQKLEQEIRAAREKILKEKKHFLAAIKELEAKLASASDETEKANIALKLSEAQGQMASLDQEAAVIDYREQNAKAGYVYVISNLGAFGEGVFKIGMTRRLEPMERVDELGDASVPFVFDVHALIFSKNAPILEAKLHEHFHHTRLNKVNHRKEFFKADIKEIEKVIKENFDNVVDIQHEAPAEHFRQSLLLC